MIPIVTPEEMAQVDAAATQSVDVLIERAGGAVAWAARRRLGGLYGRRILVVVGKGNNGADGRIAAQRLRTWGARVTEMDPSGQPPASRFDLVIDAAFGTGLSRPYTAPAWDAPVLAVDIPSGVNGLTGELVGAPAHAEITVTFQALKPGLIFSPGAQHAGVLEVADIGLDVSASRTHLLEAIDVAKLLPTRAADDHKWRSACWVIAGSPGMTGAAHLAAAAAARAGAGYVRLSVPGDTYGGPVEVVGHSVPRARWSDSMADVDRFGALVIGPGLGREASVAVDVQAAAAAPIPIVIDGDGLSALSVAFNSLRQREVPAVLTPHDGEFTALSGAPPGPDRIAATRHLAREAGSVVLLKGPATVVATPDGEALVCNEGDARLATAGTGDVLAGTIGAMLAQGLDPLHAAATGAWLHGRASQRLSQHALIASDLIGALAEVIDETHVG